MKLNPKNILFGNDEDKRGPVLLAVTPPRTGERTLLGVENLLQSIAVPEPFSLELAGDMDGVTLMARCLDDQVVRSQVSAHYPQARIQKVDPEDDPLRLAEGRKRLVCHPAGRRTGVRAPAHLPGRRPARPRLRPLHRPDGRSLSPLRGRAGGDPAAAALPRPRLVAGPSREGTQEAWHGAEGSRIHLSDQAPADGRHNDGRAGHRRSRGPEGLPVGAGRGDMEGRPHGDGRGHGTGRRRLGMVPLEKGTQPRRRPAAHQGEGLPHRLRGRSAGHGDPAPGHDAAPGRGAPRQAHSRLPALRQPRRSAVQGGEGSKPADARPVAASTPQARGSSGGAASWASARSPPCGTRPARATRRPWWSGPAHGRSAHRPRASGEARWLGTPPPARSGRSASPKTCSGVTTSMWRARGWARAR